MIAEKKFIDLMDYLDDLSKAYVERHTDFVAFIQKNDPALNGKAGSALLAEVATYPGVIAIAAHEAAHSLYKNNTLDARTEARQIAEAAHSRTGIDIHPGTNIGENCFIDHGTGDVFGETGRIGKNTVIYHGVTLGAYGKPQDIQHRHPEIGDNCLISTGVQVLGNVKIGNGVVISAGARLMGNKIQVGDNVSIGAGAQIGEGNIIANGVRIGNGVVIPPTTEPRTITNEMLQEAGIFNGYDRDKAPISIVAVDTKLGALGKMENLLRQLCEKVGVTFSL